MKITIKSEFDRVTCFSGESDMSYWVGLHDTPLRERIVFKSMKDFIAALDEFRRGGHRFLEEALKVYHLGELLKKDKNTERIKNIISSIDSFDTVFINKAIFMDIGEKDSDFHIFLRAFREYNSFEFVSYLGTDFIKEPGKEIVSGVRTEITEEGGKRRIAFESKGEYKENIDHENVIKLVYAPLVSAVQYLK